MNTLQILLNWCGVVAAIGIGFVVVVFTAIKLSEESNRIFYEE